MRGQVNLKCRTTLLAGVALATVTTVACVQPSVRHIVAPDGNQSLYITCSESGECYELAGKRCPTGYNIQRASGSVPPGYLVSCRRRAAPAPRSYAPTYAATEAPTSPSWQPRPPPSTDAWAQPVVPASPPSSSVSSGFSFPGPIGEEVDIGY